MQRLINIPEIGNIVVTKKTNAKNYRLRVHPQKGVLLTIPRFGNFKEGENFVLKNIDWIKSKLKEREIRQQNLKIFKPGEEFITRNLSLEFVEGNFQNMLSAYFENKKIQILYQTGFNDFEAEDVQEFIKKFILKCLQQEANIYLIPRLNELSQKTGLKFKNCKIGTASTRLGSCDSKNNIILSAYLMLLPDRLIDYIILHELCHILHKNHGEKFHNLLNLLTNGKSKELNKELKSFRTSIEPGNYKF